MLSFRQTRTLLSSVHIPLCKSWHITTKKGLQKIKSFPVVAKIDADIMHKTDVGCVCTHLTNAPELSQAYTKILHNAKQQTKNIYGVIVQPEITGYELIIGIKKDATFGHVILAGLGGIYAEVFKDTALRIMPILRTTAQEMIVSLKSNIVFSGYRGKKPLHMKEIISLMIKLNSLIKKYPEITELDFNPVIVNEKSATIVDARIIVS